MNIELNRDILNQIKTIDWFCNCGKEFTIKIPLFFEQVETVSRMKKEIANIKWENTYCQYTMYKLHFYNHILDIYKSIPCSWKGKGFYPKGRLLLY